MAKKTVKISTGKGNAPITFRAGGLHQTTHTPAGEKVPESKLEKAAEGDYGPKGVKQARLAKALRKMSR